MKRFLTTTKIKILVGVFALGILIALPATSWGGDCADCKEPGEASHNCRMYGAISDNVPDGMLLSNLKTDPDSLYELSPSNDDGWGVVYYPEYEDSPTMDRGPGAAKDGYGDPDYSTVISTINTSEPKITLAHVRNGSSGCSGFIDNPHPFYRDKGGKRWTFTHNGGVSKTRLENLIGSEYLDDNPPNGSGIPECASGVVDSELYFIFVMKNIEENNWNVENGIVAAVNAMFDAGETGGMNFILSNGMKIWGFRRGSSSSHTLYYIHDNTTDRYAAVASEPPSSPSSWTALNNYEFVVLTRNNDPVVFNVTDYNETKELLVDSHFNDSTDSADLRANDPNQDWYESREDVPELLVLDFNDVGGNATAKALLEAATESPAQNAYLTQEFSAPQTGVFTVQADIYVDSITDLSSDPDRAAWMLIGDYDPGAARAGPCSDDTERFVYIAFFKDGGGTEGTMDLVVRDRDDGWTAFTTVTTGLNLKQWYTIKIICDLIAGTYDIYIDGDYQDTVTSRNAKTNVTHISFGEWDDGSGAYYVDNVTAQGPADDTTPPTPDPMEWAVDGEPNALSYNSITMTAATAADDTTPVYYYFECTTDGDANSGWQTNTTYVATGLNPETQYTFRVKARDSAPAQNETGWSSAESATTPVQPPITVYDFDGITSPSSTHTAEDGEIDVADSMIEGGTFPARRDTINGWANWGEATTAEYAALVGSDDNRYQGAGAGWGDNAAMIFEFYVSEAPEDLEQIDMSVELGRGASTDLGWVYIWNYNTNSYLVLGSQSGTADQVVSASISVNPGDYIEPGTGQLTIFVVNENDGWQNDWIRVDDIKVTVYSQVAPPKYTLTTSSTDGGSVTTPGEPGPFDYNDGQVVPIVATADTGYHFVEWTDDISTIADPCSENTNITMNADYDIVANFAIYTFTLDYAAGHTVNVTFKIMVYVIFGYVTEPDVNVPVEGVFIDANNGGGSDTTDANGYYQLTVDYGWSGTVEPNKTGYAFEPNSIDYDNVTTDQNDNYIAILDTFIISGYAVDSEMLTPLEGVLVSPDNDGGPFTSKYYGGSDTTDVNGYYEVLVDYNWSGEVVPSKYAYGFDPNSKTYVNVTEDVVEEQDYAGTLLTYTITGYIKNSCEVPIEGVLVDANNAGGQDTTDSNGFYEVWVDYNWSGTVTPTKKHYTFEPNSKAYTDVLEDKTGQDYLADNIYDLDCNGSIGFGDVAIISENWLDTGPDVPGDLHKDEDDIVNFLDFAEFGLVW